MQRAINAPSGWYMPYLDKPWAAVPQPPQSYTCGELMRAVHLDLFGLDSPPIAVADATDGRDCLSAMSDPSFYGLRPLAPHERPRSFDVVFFARAGRADHVGIVCESIDGLLALHCVQRMGVRLDGMADLRGGWGFRRMLYWRHANIDAALELRGWLRG